MCSFVYFQDILALWNMPCSAERMYCNYAERSNCSDSSATFTNRWHAKTLPQEVPSVCSFVLPCWSQTVWYWFFRNLLNHLIKDQNHHSPLEPARYLIFQMYDATKILYLCVILMWLLIPDCRKCNS